MSRRLITVVALTALALAAPGLGRAQEGRLNRLEDRIQALEDQLSESQAIIKAQQEELKVRGGTGDVAAGAASVDGFLKSVQIGGHLAASYGYNFNNPRFNAGANTLCQFNCNHNEFSFDAAKLNLSKPASEPGTVGFQLDLLYGQNAAVLDNLAPTVENEGTNHLQSDSHLFIEQAFASYNVGGVQFKAGKFDTLLGYEVFDTDLNPNVTHGVLFTYAIPAVHTGLMAGGNLSETTSWAAGIVNGFNNTRELGDSKGFVGKLAWTSGPVLAQLANYTGTLGETRTTLSGDTIGDNSLQTAIWDGILQYAYSESSKLWLNVDVGRTQRHFDFAGNRAGTARFFGAALGWKQQLSEKMFFAVRGELLKDPQGARLGGLGLAINGFTRVDPADPTSAVVLPTDLDVYTGTVTLGYQLAPNLMARLEFRRDYVRCTGGSSSCNFFYNSNASSSAAANRKTSNLAVMQLVYSFE